jgi:DNA helicase-2/ATP-dependent DNA helicase PcrA
MGVVEEFKRIATEQNNRIMSGNPLEDWLAVRHLFGNSTARPIMQIAEDAKYLRLLYKGTLLRSNPSELCREMGIMPVSPY